MLPLAEELAQQRQLGLLVWEVPDGLPLQLPFQEPSSPYPGWITQAGHLGEAGRAGHPSLRKAEPGPLMCRWEAEAQSTGWDPVACKGQW